MKHYPTSAFLMFTTMFAIPTMADRAVGNGGDAVVCRSGGSLSAELLDFYEARAQRSIIIDIGPPTLAVDEKLELLLTRISAVSPKRGNRYREHIKDFWSNSLFKKGIQLVDVPDSQHVILPLGCLVEQLAVQSEPRFPEDKRYVVNEDLWDALSNDGKAGLVLHEVIYREALSNSASDSIGTRYLNSLIAGDALSSMTQKRLFELFKSVKFMTIEANGFQFLFEEANFYQDGRLSKGTALFKNEDTSLTVPGKGTLTILKGDRFGVDENSLTVTFHSNGNLASLTGMKRARWQMQAQWQIQGKEVALSCNSFNLHPDGNYRSGCLLESPQTLSLGNGKPIDVPQWSALSFSENGNLIELTTEESDRRRLVSSPSGERLEYVGPTFEWHESGLVKSGRLQGTYTLNYENRRRITVGEGGKWSKITFWPSGHLKMGFVKAPQTFSTKAGEWTSLAESDIELFENGEARRGTLSAATKFRLGSLDITFPYRSSVLFDHQGRLVGAGLFAGEKLKIPTENGETFESNGSTFFCFNDDGKIKLRQTESHKWDLNSDCWKN